MSTSLGEKRRRSQRFDYFALTSGLWRRAREGRGSVARVNEMQNNTTPTGAKQAKKNLINGVKEAGNPRDIVYAPPPSTRKA